VRVFKLDAEGDYIMRFLRAATMTLEARGQRLEVSQKTLREHFYFALTKLNSRS